MAAGHAASELPERSELLALFRPRGAQTRTGRLVIESRAMWTRR